MNCRWICLALVIWFAAAAPAHASGLRIGVEVSMPEEGGAVGELRLDGKLLWRLRLASDTVLCMVRTSVSPAQTTLVVPDLRDGQFLLRLFSE